MKQLTVRMLLYGDPSYDGRVQREVHSLVSAGYHVEIDCVTYSDPRAAALPDEVIVKPHRQRTREVPRGHSSPFRPDLATSPIRGRSAKVRWLVSYSADIIRWGRSVRSSGAPPDIWHAHDLTGLAALGRVGRGRNVVYDSHELFLESGSASRLPPAAKRVLRAYEGMLARRARRVITVNDGVAAVLREGYGVGVDVVMNCPPWRDTPPRGALRATLDLGDRRLIVYHGGVSPNRGVEIGMEALQHLPADVAMVVIGSGPSVNDVREASGGRLRDRLFWHPPVPSHHLPELLVDADVGLVLFAPTERNHLLASPNKLFDFIACGVPVLASAFPVMGQIVTKEGVGVTCDPTDARAVARGVMEIISDSEKRRRMRANAIDAYAHRYNWEIQERILLSVYGSMAAQ